MKVFKEEPTTTPHLLKLNVDIKWHLLEINGRRYNESIDDFPCRYGNTWFSIIDVKKGKILNWREGFSAKIYYDMQPTDELAWELVDEKGDSICSYSHNGNVKVTCNYLFSNKDLNKFSDFIKATITKNGKIRGWKFDENVFYQASALKQIQEANNKLEVKPIDVSKLNIGDIFISLYDKLRYQLKSISPCENYIDLEDISGTIHTVNVNRNKEFNPL